MFRVPTSKTELQRKFIDRIKDFTGIPDFSLVEDWFYRLGNRTLITDPFSVHHDFNKVPTRALTVILYLESLDLSGTFEPTSGSETIFLDNFGSELTTHLVERGEFHIVATKNEQSENEEDSTKRTNKKDVIMDNLKKICSLRRDDIDKPLDREYINSFLQKTGLLKFRPSPRSAIIFDNVEISHFAESAYFIDPSERTDPLSTAFHGICDMPSGRRKSYSIFFKSNIEMMKALKKMINNTCTDC